MQVPNHIAVILDGNRRWAQLHRMKSWEGHKTGGETADKFLQWCLDIGIKQISLYALSTENLNRPRHELEKIYDVICNILRRWLNRPDFFKKYQIKVNFVGDLTRLPTRLLSLMKRIIDMTMNYKRKVVNILIAYGAKLEITNAVKTLLSKVMQRGKIEITSKDIEENLMVQRPVDLVIRTGGFSRLSNFLLWQTAYAEMFVTNTLWPDFSKRELVKALKWFTAVKRNFGK